MKAWTRGERVGKLVRQILADRLSRGTSERDLEGVIITDVKMAPDIKMASIYFQLLQGDREPARVERALAALERAKHLLHQELRKQMKIKFVPTLRFFHDASLDRVHRLESIFRELDDERHDDES
ncbi:MAG: 30S ribosome-binding factor RbfA [Pseudomonadota bacterium]